MKVNIKQRVNMIGALKIDGVVAAGNLNGPDQVPGFRFTARIHPVPLPWDCARTPLQKCPLTHPGSGDGPRLNATELQEIL